MHRMPCLNSGSYSGSAPLCNSLCCCYCLPLLCSFGTSVLAVTLSQCGCHVSIPTDKSVCFFRQVLAELPARCSLQWNALHLCHSAGCPVRPHPAQRQPQEVRIRAPLPACMPSISLPILPSQLDAKLEACTYVSCAQPIFFRTVYLYHLCALKRPCVNRGGFDQCERRCSFGIL